MERDFMGLNSKDSIVAVKEEVVEGGCKDSGFARSSGVPWPLSNKVSALPHFTSLKFEQDEKPGKLNSDLLASHGHMLKSGSDTIEASNKRQFGDFQNFVGPSMKQQFIGGHPHTGIPSTAAVAGATKQLINSKVPAQLTIFYAGTVNVFDDISPEKAQAIMFLAGNHYVSSNKAQSKIHVQGPASKYAGAEQGLVNQSMTVPPSSGLPSPMSVSSHPIDQSNTNQDDVKNGMSTTTNKVEPPRMVSSMGSLSAKAMISSAVPQARKASLARFLEKRKERVMSAAPYNLSKKAGDCPTPDSNSLGFSATSGGGSSPLSASKETTGDI